MLGKGFFCCQPIILYFYKDSSGLVIKQRDRDTKSIVGEETEREEAISIGGVMGVPYHKLPESRRAKTGLRTKAWVIVRRAAAKAVRLCMGRRRLAAMYVKRVACPGLWARVRRAVTGSRPTPVTSYDSDGYAQNFDDGRWKEEEEEFWKSGSFAYRFGGSGRFVT